MEIMGSDKRVWVIPDPLEDGQNPRAVLKTLVGGIIIAVFLTGACGFFEFNMLWQGTALQAIVLAIAFISTLALLAIVSMGG